MALGQRGFSPPRLRQHKTLALGVATLVTGAALMIPGTAPAQEAPDLYAGFASGDGMRINFRVPDFLVVEDFIDAGAPAAEARIDSVEGSKGFASAPYPGQAAIAGPGLFAFATGQQFPASYPWYAASADPATPESTVDQNGIHLESRSAPQSSHSTALLGAEGSGRASSDAKVIRAEDGVVTAAASTLAEVLHLGPIVLSGVTSNASVVRRPGGEPERSSSLQAATFTIAGQGVVITPGGIVLGGTDIPAGEAPGIKEALAGANVTVETIKAQETPDGIVAPGLRISTTQDLPGAGVPGTVTYTLGQARASATVGAASAVVVSPAPTDPGSDAAAPPAPTQSTQILPSDTAAFPDTPAAITDPATTVAPITAGATSPAFSAYGQRGLPSPATESLTDTSATTGVAAPAPAPGSAARSEQAELAVASVGSASSVSPFMWFPALVIAGVIVGLALHGQRLMRVRKSWSS